MELKNNSIAKLEKISDNLYVLDYGRVIRMMNGDRQLIMTSDKVLQHILLDKSCSCTMPTFEKVSDNELKLDIKYNTNLLGKFSKSVFWTYKEDNKKNQITIKIKGEVYAR